MTGEHVPAGMFGDVEGAISLHDEGIYWESESLMLTQGACCD